MSVFIGDSTGDMNEYDRILRDGTGQVVDGCFNYWINPNNWNFTYFGSVPAPVQAGDVYTVELYTYNISGGFSIGYSGQVPTGNNSLLWAWTNDEYHLKHVPMIRLELDDPNGIKEHEKQVLKLHPNPVQDKVWVSLPGATQDGYIEILSVDGKVLELHAARSAVEEIDVSHLAEDAYILRLIQGRR